MVALGGGADRFAIGDLRRLGVHVQAAIGEFLQDESKVQFADAVDDHFVGLPVGMPAERWILLGKLGELERELGFVAAGLGRDRQPVHRRRESQRPEVHVVQGMVVVQHVVGVNLLDLGDRADVAGDDLGGLAMLLALQMEDVAELDRFFVLPDVDLRLARAFSLVDAEDGQLADVRDRSSP